LGANLDISHFALDLGSRDERGDGVDDDDIDGVAAHEGFGDFEGLLSSIRLGDEELGRVDTQA